MRICPKCKLESPSAAKHCMFCESLIIMEELVEEEKFRLNLNLCVEGNKRLRGLDIILSKNLV